jgi:2'-5' RNA ligase
VSPFPVRMSDHWADPAGTDPHRQQLMWPVTVSADQAAAGLAAEARRRLADVPGLDLVPLRWLHLTTLTSGPADEMTDTVLATLTGAASRLLASVPPVTITLGRVLYHPRAVMLDAGPQQAFQPLIGAIQAAARHAGLGTALYHEPWRPHITLAYRNASGPATPLIEALGRSLPAAEVTIRSVSLVAQSPAQRWTWDLIAGFPLAPG